MRVLADLLAHRDSLLRLRQELDKLLAYQAGKIPDQGKQRAFLQTHYEELLAGLSVSLLSSGAVLPRSLAHSRARDGVQEGLSSHSRSQAEVSHFREMGRQAGGRG